MDPVLLPSIAQIETKKSEIVRMSKLVSDSETIASSPSRPWSPAQVVDHLVKFEELLLSGHEKLLAAGKPLNSGLKSRVFVSVTGLMIRAKWRFGTTKNLEPAQQIDLDKRMSDWSKVHETLTFELDKIPSSALGAAFTIHPIAGPLNAEETVKLISLHLDYHIRFFPKV